MKLLRVISIINLFAFLLRVSIPWGFSRTVRFPYSIDFLDFIEYGIPLISMILFIILILKKETKVWLFLTSIPLISGLIRVMATTI